MEFKHYVILKNEEEAEKLFLILSYYKTNFDLRFDNFSTLSKTFNKNFFKLRYATGVMFCIEDKRLSYNTLDYDSYAKRNNLKKITLEQIFKEW